MIFYVLIGILGLVLALWLLRQVAYADTRTLLRGLKWGTAGLVGAAGIYLLLTGRLMQAAFAVSALAPMFVRWRAAWQGLRNATGAAQRPTPGKRSTVETNYLAMILDHDTGELGGTVRQGPFSGRDLAALTLDELIELWRVCRAEDAQGAALLETYLDRTQAADWRDRANATGASGATSDEAMTRAQALAILGLADNADETAIREAHRRLMMANHPDRGGSTFLATQINRAKDVLLERRAGRE
ncbi:MAG: molecular chaperone DnaJ [Alphaproteobacteria bacterium]|nr:molecular chaperone DnaJ [Alphaproteobacteria bacterium]